MAFLEGHPVSEFWLMIVGIIWLVCMMIFLPLWLVQVRNNVKALRAEMESTVVPFLKSIAHPKFLNSGEASLIQELAKLRSQVEQMNKSLANKEARFR